MSGKPKLKSHLEARVVGPETVLLCFETGRHAVDGWLYPLLIPLLDGTRTAAELADLLDGKATILDIGFGLSWLAAQGWLAAEDDNEPRGRAAFRELLGVPRDAFDARLAGCRVAVHSLCADAAEPMRCALESAGIRVDEDGDLAVVLTDDYLRPELSEFNLRALETGRPWLLVKPAGLIVSIGPVFRPGETACWHCLAERLRENPERCGPSTAVLPSTLQAAVNLAATETLKWIVRGGADDEITTVDLRSLRTTRHRVLPREGCACGRKAEAPPDLESHIDTLTGIVQSIEPVWDKPGSPVSICAARHNFSLRYGATPLRHRTSAGKGSTAAEARRGAVYEALERYSGLFRGYEKRVHASYRDLGGEAVHPNTCMQFSAAQYAARQEWNRREAEFNWVPEPFREDDAIDWAPFSSLTRGGIRYLPAAYSYYGYPAAAGHDFCRPDSNGNAAGTTFENAVLRGLMEVVERDSVAIWWYNRLRKPAVDRPEIEAFRSYYRDLERDLWVLDVTSDLGIPAFAAISRGTARPANFIFGFAAGFDVRDAILRALREMSQFLPQAAAGRDWSVPDCSFLAPECAPSKPLDETGPADALDEGLRILAAHGMEVLALDQTRSDVGLPVAKVVVPGMRPFWARFGPGRLYTVPVEMGWLPTATAEAALNPVHLAI